MKVSRVEEVLAEAIRQDIISDDDPAALLYDTDEFANTIGQVQRAFPESTLHTIAVKANPVSRLLEFARDRGLGAECASLPELQHALRIGFTPTKVVFDSPAKTVGELSYALEKGVYLNIDNFQELERISALTNGNAFLPRCGLRINPQIAPAPSAAEKETYTATNTSIPTSKFGIPLTENRDQVIQAFRKYSWLRGLHVHSGSQFVPVEDVVKAVRLVVELAKEIRSVSGRAPDIIDIGGGLPVNYENDESNPHLSKYLAGLWEQCPDLFNYSTVTEFGRLLNSKSGWAVTRVEYTKESGNRPIAVGHFGADLFVRTAYVPERWQHRVTVHSPSGKAKTGQELEQNIAGPLCFSGDLVASSRVLPRIEVGDLVVIHDAGAYTLSMWSRYNSRQSPAVYGYRGDSRIEIQKFRARETVDDVLRFWA